MSLSPTFNRVKNVDDIPSRFRSRNSSRLKCVPTATISSAPFSWASRMATSSLIPGEGKTEDGSPSRSIRSRPGAPAVGIGVDDELGAALERLVRDRVHVADDHVRLVAGLDQGVGAAVDADEHGLEVADVRLDDVKVALHPGAAGHDERVSIPEARLHLREPDALGQKLGLVAQIAEGVLGEALERLRDAPALLGQLRLEVRLRQGATGREARTVAEEARAADDEGLAVPDLLEEVESPFTSMSRTPPRTSSSGPAFGKRPLIDGETLMTTRTFVARSSSADTRSRSRWSMIAMSSGPRRLTRRFVLLSSLAVPVNSTKLIAGPLR